MTKVLVGIPCGSGTMPALMVQSLLQLHKPKECGVMIVSRQRTDKARNACVKTVLEHGFTHLLFVDDDNPVPDNALEVLLEDDKDIVSTPILSRTAVTEGTYPLCSFYATERQVGDKKLTYYEHIKEFKDKGPLHRVDATGTGCVLIKRKVLQAVAREYEYPFEFGDITVNGQRRTMSEDVEFCERATKLGFEIWVDDRIRPLHITGIQYNQYNP